MIDYSVLSLEQVAFIHEKIIDFSGGVQGVLDIGLLHSAIERPKATFIGDDLYPELVDKAAALMELMTQNHSFVDGNKRTAFTMMSRFLEANGVVLKASQDEIVEFCVGVAEGMELVEIGKWVENRIVR